jgi:hypothetical protein
MKWVLAAVLAFTINAYSAPCKPQGGRKPPCIATTSLPQGTLGQSYSYQLVAYNGTGTLTWSLYSGSLPPGITLSSTGRLSGTPATQGIYGFTVRVQDALGAAVYLEVVFSA